MYGSFRRILYVPIVALGLDLASCPRAFLWAAEVRIDCRVLYGTPEGIYVDLGTDSGVTSGQEGWLEQNGERLAPVEVAKVVRNSTFLRVDSERAVDFPALGDRVSLVFDLAPEEVGERKEPSRTLKDQTSDQEPFVPLMSRVGKKSEAFTEAKNIFHGRLTLREALQITTESDHDYSRTRLRSSGSLQRIEATPWALEWSGDLSYRTGEGLENRRDFEALRLEAYRLALFRRFEDRSFVRLGRFIPRELPSVGFLDGVHGEKVITEQFRLGGMVGFKPTRRDLDVSVDEPAFVGYGTFAIGDRSGLYYSGTGGILFTLFEGDGDRLAILLDQAAFLGRLSIYSSTEVDFDVGGADVRDGVRLTRWDLHASYPIAPLLTLNAGLNRYELPDNEGERQAIDRGGLNVEEFFEDSYTRYWAGAFHDLPWNLRLSEEISFTDSQVDDAIRWNVSLTRLGLPFSPEASMTLTAYNFEGIRIEEGYGGRLSMHIPLMNHRLLLQPATTFRWVKFETAGENFFDYFAEDFTVTDVSLRAHWIISKSWVFSAGVSYANTNDVDRYFVDLGLTFRW